MNIERLTALAEYLERPAIPYDFNMNKWLSLEGTSENNWCGTRCCLAGLTALLFSPGEPTPYNVPTKAQLLLELSERQADNLFMPATATRYTELNRSHAALAVRNLIAGSETPWAFA